MIDRRTALSCAVLIALMVAVALAEIVFGEGNTPATLWQLFQLPFAAAMLVGSLYESGRRTIDADAKVKPWYDLGKLFSIGSCVCLLFAQCFRFLVGIAPEIPLPAVIAVGAAIVLASTVIILTWLDQIPKLPWLEGGPWGGDIGPIYGRRFRRLYAKIGVAHFLAIIASCIVLPMQAWPYIPLALPLFPVWGIVLHLHYSRKWQLEQSSSASG